MTDVQCVDGYLDPMSYTGTIAPLKPILLRLPEYRHLVILPITRMHILGVRQPLQAPPATVFVVDFRVHPGGILRFAGHMYTDLSEWIHRGRPPRFHSRSRRPERAVERTRRQPCATRRVRVNRPRRQEGRCSVAR